MKYRFREVKEETNIDLDKLAEIQVRTFKDTSTEPIYRLFIPM